jgi:SAM-dependent methyltransferase
MEMIWARDDLNRFWRRPSPPGNDPRSFTEYVNRSRILHILIGDVPKDARILEVGCNSGRNLAYLHDQGYRRLEGIEISDHAVHVGREIYPQLADINIRVGPAEDILPTLKERYDLIFSMAVLSMLHPECVNIFGEISRLTDSVLAVEPAHGVSSSRHYPHDLAALFTERGLPLVSMDLLATDPRLEGEVDGAMDGYAAWRFAR